MAFGIVAATQLVVEAWALLVAAGAIVVGMFGTGMSIVFYLGGRIDGLTTEVGLVRERVARLEGSSGLPAPEPPPTA